MNYVLSLQDSPHLEQMGQKACALSQLLQQHWLIPPGFIITPEAFMASLTAQQRDQFREWQHQEKCDFQAIQDFFTTVRVGEGVQSAILQMLAALFPYGGQFAVRSSATEEDRDQYSLAGQLSTFLSVTPEQLESKIVQVWQSAYQPTVLHYRQQFGLNGLPKIPSILVQQMLNPQASGVAFGADPLTGRRNLRIVTSVYGLGTSLVSGDSDADTFYLDTRHQIIQRHIAHKVQAAYPNPLSETGFSLATLTDDRATQPSLTDEQVEQISQLVQKAGKFFGCPQDIEWAIAETGQLYLLQSRPITALPNTSEPTGFYQLWDNSNIAESYSGVTTPLTFAFACRAYTEIYQQFCLLMGISAAKIQQNKVVFANMIGLRQGRIYYNLLNWYRVLAMLPGFRLNRQFMEQMMGVKEGLPPSILEDLQSQNSWRDALHLVRSLLKLWLNYAALPLQIWQFQRRLHRVLNLPTAELSHLRLEELVQYYRELEQELLTHWQAPIVNDFFAMIFYGVLRKLTAKWCRDRDGSLANLCVQNAGQVRSAQPARQIQQMAQLIRENPFLTELFCTGTTHEILATLKYHPELEQRYQHYLAKFSDRCLDELKLESPTLTDNPLPLLRSIGWTARETKSFLTPPENAAHWLRLKRRLRRQPLRRWLLGWVVHNARKRLRDRENLRFERTRVFGYARRIFQEFGKRLFVADVLRQPQDIFYLEVAEILRFIEGTSTTTDLKSLIALRQVEFNRYRTESPPPDRFATYGIPSLSTLPTRQTQPATTEENCRQGLGCSAGIVRGMVTVIHDPQAFLTQPQKLPMGAILVAERTDPGWILLFASAAGLIVERGSLLSHAAIVSRELNLPAIVSIPGITHWLKDGDWVELNGNTGVVTKLSEHYELVGRPPEAP